MRKAHGLLVAAAVLAAVAVGCATAGGDQSAADAAMGTVDAFATFDAPIGFDAPPAPDAPVIDGPLAPDARVDAASADAPTGDARPPDARPDARPPADAGPPDAPRPDAACRVDLLDNTSFDSSTGSGDDKEITPWLNVITAGQRPMLVASAVELVAVGASVQAGPYAAWLGGGNGVAHGLYANFTVPGGTRDLVLTGQFWVRTTEGTATIEDFLHIYLLDDEGFILEEIGKLSEVQKGMVYVSRTFSSAAPHAGEQLTLALWATTDATVPTDFFVDTLRLEAILCL